MKQLLESIPRSPSDELLRLWGYDLTAEYMTVLAGVSFPVTTPILELATGSGRMCAVLARRGYRVWTGDNSLERKPEAERRISPAFLHLVDFLALDMEILPFRDGSVRSIVCMNTLHELSDPRRCLEEILRVLATDGILVMGDFNDEGFRVMQRLQRVVYGDVHKSGSLAIGKARTLLASRGFAIRSVETSLNITLIVRP